MNLAGRVLRRFQIRLIGTESRKNAVRASSRKSGVPESQIPIPQNAVSFSSARNNKTLSVGRSGSP